MQVDKAKDMKAIVSLLPNWKHTPLIIPTMNIDVEEEEPEISKMVEEEAVQMFKDALVQLVQQKIIQKENSLIIFKDCNSLGNSLIYALRTVLSKNEDDPLTRDNLEKIRELLKLL